jgi:hypothetical protein
MTTSTWTINFRNASCRSLVGRQTVSRKRTREFGRQARSAVTSRRTRWMGWVVCEITP